MKTRKDLALHTLYKAISFTIIYHILTALLSSTIAPTILSFGLSSTFKQVLSLMFLLLIIFATCSYTFLMIFFVRRIFEILELKKDFLFCIAIFTRYKSIITIFKIVTSAFKASVSVVIVFFYAIMQSLIAAGSTLNVTRCILVTIIYFVFILIAGWMHAIPCFSSGNDEPLQ